MSPAFSQISLTDTTLALLSGTYWASQSQQPIISHALGTRTVPACDMCSWKGQTDHQDMQNAT